MSILVQRESLFNDHVHGQLEPFRVLKTPAPRWQVESTGFPLIIKYLDVLQSNIKGTVIGENVNEMADSDRLHSVWQSQLFECHTKLTVILSLNTARRTR